eukprot:TRINITY_DN33320_c0_g1_i1.p1 TRINITY_DN33320_c0_g1~~TRINITY_DN33320_c0_g1_i1.p1  ORF type:complete len:310 (-),score=71.18 TRINITY_DN33320_c0_g1_i1:40-969(-)
MSAADASSPGSLGLAAAESCGTSADALTKAPTEMPARFVCYQCGACIATSDALSETRDDILVFSQLRKASSSPPGSSSASGDSRTVQCLDCGTAVGTRTDSSFLLRHDRVEQRLERLEILVCSLKQQEISELSPVLREAFPHSNVRPKVLQKAELRGFQLTGLRPEPELVVVVHRNEGRTLLTDRNGFYHDVLGSAWQQTQGNVFVVLTRTEPKAEDDLFDRSLLGSLSTQGDQPTIGAISELGRVLTWGNSPSAAQLQQLVSLMTRAYFREPGPPNAQGIPSQWIRVPSKAHHAQAGQNASAAWCALL